MPGHAVDLTIYSLSYVARGYVQPSKPRLSNTSRIISTLTPEFESRKFCDGCLYIFSFLFFFFFYGTITEQSGSSTNVRNLQKRTEICELANIRSNYQSIILVVAI